MPVKATVHDTEKGLYAEDRITIIFEPSSITGVVKDNKTGEPIAGAKVVVTKTFEDGTTFRGEYVTEADGKYKIPIPRGDEQYDVEITKSIIVNGEPEEVTFKQKAEAGEITADKTDEEFPAKETFTGVVIMKDKNGKDKIVRKDFGDKIVIKQITSEGFGKQGEINSSGVFTVEGLEKGKPYEFAVIVDVDGKEVIMGKIKVILDSDGEIRIHEELVDPFGTITDSETGEVLGGVKVELYYADTPRNRQKGRTPGTLVDLPILPGFAPNDNKNPQMSVPIPVWSDEAGGHGNYAWMVFPEGDYYILAKKPGYKDYTSPTISVEYDIVKHDFAMDPILSSEDSTPGDGTPATPDGGSSGDGTSVTPDGGSVDNSTNVNGSDNSNSQTSEQSLPQTGEERNLVLLFGGIIAILIGASLIVFRRKTKVS